MPHFLAGSSIKKIHEWVDKLLTGQNVFNIHKALKLFVTIPITIVTLAFSKLSLVKTKLRSRTKQEKLDAMMMISVKQELACEINPLINR